MSRLLSLLLLVGGFLLLPPTSRAADQEQPKRLPPPVSEWLKDTPAEFIKRFDKNKDGVLTPDELPPFLKDSFERMDSNGDGKVDEQEAAAALTVLRRRFGQAAPTAAGRPNPEAVDRLVNMILDRLDTNKDGKVSKDEAKGSRIADAFDRADTNKDGFLDKDELRQFAVRMVAAQGGPPGRPGLRPDGATPAAPDFDALDKDADGRLTREELQGTPLADKFDAIDANKDGKIDRKEFLGYFRKLAEKK